jgi:hypothetical protein
MASLPQLWQHSRSLSLLEPLLIEPQRLGCNFTAMVRNLAPSRVQNMSLKVCNNLQQNLESAAYSNSTALFHLVLLIIGRGTEQHPQPPPAKLSCAQHLCSSLRLHRQSAAESALDSGL